MIRFGWLLVSLLIAIGFLVLTGLKIGEQSLSFPDLLHSLALSGGGASDATRMIVVGIRLPRVLLAAVVGLALGVAGAIAQSLMRNPLAEPGLLGINAGAALAALTMTVFFGITSPNAITLGAFGGAMTIASLIYFLSWREGSSSLRIILIGIGLSVFCAAGSSFITVFGDIVVVQRNQAWLAGTTYLATWRELFALCSFVLPATLLAIALARELDMLSFEEEIARSLGQSVQIVRAGSFLLCVLLSAAAVSAAGPIGFVGLIAPHIARALVGWSHGRLLPTAALVGAALLLVADMLGRTVIAPAQLPVGLVTALLGAPAFAYIFWRTRNVGA